MKRAAALSAVFALAAALPPAAQAAGGGAAAPVDQSATKPARGIEEIVVTAQKRAERLSRVPLSVKAIGRAQLDKQGVRRVEDVARLVPGLTLRPGNQLGDTQISIRGIQSNTGSATTGVYVDETPVQSRQEVVASNPYPRVFDLDRVEVLRGPQGTLFGAGSEGGTVRFITPEPSVSARSGYLRGDLSGTANGAPSGEFGVAYGAPLVPEVLGLRVSLWDRVDGGYIDRIDPITLRTTEPNANSQHTTVGRAALRWQVTPDFSLTPAVYYQRIRAEDRDYAWEGYGSFKALARFGQPRTDTFVLPSLTARYDFGPATLTSVSSYFRRFLSDTFDATSYELSGLLPDGGIYLPGSPNYSSRGVYRNEQRNWVQELRLSSNDTPDSRLSWSVGFYYQNNRSALQSTYAEPFDEVADYLSEYYGYGPGDSLSYFGQAPVGGQYSYLQRIRVTESDIAGFGTVTLRLLPDVRATVGLRFEQTEFSYDDLQDGPYGPGAPTTYAGAKSETPVTPRFSLAWQMTPDRMIYATVARGYRIGGANESVLGITSCEGDLQQLGIRDVPQTFNSDSVWSYEAGIKSGFLDNTLRIDGSAFWIDWSDIQQQVLLPSCGYYYTGNLGSATSRGFDMEVRYQPIPGLTLTANTGFTDAQFNETNTVAGSILALKGDPLATPQWTATGAAQQDFRLSESLGGYARIDYQYSGPFYRTGSAATFSYNPNVRNAAATNFLSLRAGLRLRGWDVSAYIDNVLNSRVSLYRYQDTVNSPGLRNITFRPLTAGITLIEKF